MIVGPTLILNIFLFINLIMQSDNVFIINMKKDIGKRLHMQQLKSITGAIFWDGIDISELKDDYLVKYADIKQATYAAKMAKFNLFKYFLNSSKAQYLFLFEDDIYMHIDFKKGLMIANNFLDVHKPLLLYFGVSNNRVFNDKKDIAIELLSNKMPCPGAYGVCINRFIIPYLLSYIQDPALKYDPFDITCLGTIQLMMPDKCFVMNPPLVIPDISISNIRGEYDQEIYYLNSGINKMKYIFPETKPLFVVGAIIDVNKKLYNVFRPYYKITYVKKIPDNLTDYQYYVVINGNIKFKYYEGNKIIDNIESNIHNYKKIIFATIDPEIYMEAISMKIDKENESKILTLKNICS
jgi:hypothetical protein